MVIQNYTQKSKHAVVHKKADRSQSFVLKRNKIAIAIYIYCKGTGQNSSIKIRVQTLIFLRWSNLSSPLSLCYAHKKDLQHGFIAANNKLIWVSCTETCIKQPNQTKSLHISDDISAPWTWIEVSFAVFKLCWKVSSLALTL